MQNINSVVITGNLTRDPDLRSTEGGTKVANLRVAVNGRRKNGNEEWVDKPNYFNVTVWGAQGESCAEYLAKGRPVAVEGRLNFRERDTDDGHREYVSIIAETVQFLGGKPKDEDGGAEEPEQAEEASEEDADDIPF
ncbi:MAG TPA: single-stranded DNA-binding protein [Solirubrobacterales bacterium]|jgi:single-strand DNA-binding protein|nr:single-stranded DNA-binding protein [Solirubrobacterales bacterium]